MTVSMWMLADWLAKYNPEVKIVDGSRNIQAARICSDEIKITRGVLYISEDSAGRIICAHSHDIISIVFDDVFQIFNEILDMFEFYNTLEADIEDAIKSGEAIDKILELSYRALPYYMLIADASFLMKASYGHSDLYKGESNFIAVQQNKLLPLNALVSINSQPQIRMKGKGAYQINIPGSLNIITAAYNLFAGDEHTGWFVILKANAAFSKGEFHIIEAIGSLIEMYQNIHADQNNTMNKASIFIDLLDKDEVDSELIDKRLRAFGWFETDIKQVYVISGKLNQKNNDHALDARLYLMGDGAFKMVYQNAVVIFLNHSLTDARQFEKELTYYIRGTELIAGKSEPFRNIFHLKQYYEAARTAAQYSDKQGNIVRFIDTAVSYSISVMKDHVFTDVSHPALAALRSYDSEHKSEMYHTLEIFLEYERNYTKTAQILNIHRSTLIYRLERIIEITSLNLEDPDVRFHLLLSFRLAH